MPTRGFGVKVELKVDKSRNKQFNKEIKDAIEKIDVGEKLTVTKASLATFTDAIKNTVSPAVAKAISDSVSKMQIEIDSVKIKAFDTKSAVANLRTELEKMFSALSLKNGVNVTAIKDLIDAGGDENKIRKVQEDNARRKSYLEEMRKEISLMESMYSKYSVGGSKELDAASLETYRKALASIREEYNRLQSGATDLANYNHSQWMQMAQDAQTAAKSVRDAIEQQTASEAKAKKDAAIASKNKPKEAAEVVKEDTIKRFNDTWKKFVNTMAANDISEYISKTGLNMNELYDSANQGAATLDEVSTYTGQMAEQLDERAKAITRLNKAETSLSSTRERLKRNSINLTGSANTDYTNYQQNQFGKSTKGLTTDQINARAAEAEKIKQTFDSIKDSAIDSSKATGMLETALTRLKSTYSGATKDNQSWGRDTKVSVIDENGVAAERTVNDLYEERVALINTLLQTSGTYNKETVEQAVNEANHLSNLIDLNKTEYASVKARLSLQNQYLNLIKSNTRIKGTGMEASINSAAAALGDTKNAMTRVDFDKFRANLSDTKIRMRELGLEGKSLGDSIKDAYKRFGGWSIVTRSLTAVWQALKRMVTNVINLDTAMTELYKVTNETSKAYDTFFDKAAERAKAFGATITDTITATADFARLGYNLEDAANLADSAIVYKSVGD